MDQYSKKYSIPTTSIHSQIGKNAIQLMDNRPMSSLQRILSKSNQQASPLSLQRKTRTEHLVNNLSDKNNLEITENHKPLQRQTTKTAAKNNTVTQLARSKQEKKKDYYVEKKKKDRQNAINPLRRYHDIKNIINQKINTVKLYIKKVEEQLDDDEDIQLIESYSNSLNQIKIISKRTLNQIIALPAPKGNLRSQTVDVDKLEALLNGYSLKVNLIKIELNKRFPMNAGGFGAKGRAHNADTEVNPQYKPVGKALNNNYFENITLNNQKSGVNIYKSSPIVPKQKPGPLQIMGKTYEITDTQNKAELYEELEKELSGINISQDVIFKNTPVGKDRGEGQYKNMGNTNAAGYAWLLNGLGNQRWEWLHIRGAGLGGKTDSTNLVAGARDSNTHMIPFESNIRHLGTAVKNNSKKYSYLDVKWSVSGKLAKHAYQIIRIQWSLIKIGGAKQASGDVFFKPLDTGNNISKNEVNKIEEILTDIRNEL